MSLASITSHVPVDQPAPNMPKDASRHTPTPEAPNGNNAAAAAANEFENYLPPTDTASSQPNRDSLRTIGDSGSIVSHDGQPVSAKAVLKKIIGEWEKNGVDQECIATARRLLASDGDSISDLSRSGLLKLKEELEKTNEWAMLRKQAIDMVCTGEPWERSLDIKAAQEPGVSRDLIKQRITASLFSWTPDNPASDAFILKTVISFNLQKEAGTWEPPKQVRNPLRTHDAGQNVAAAA